MTLDSQERIFSVFLAMERGIKQVVASGKELMTKTAVGDELAAVETATALQLIRLEQGLVTIHALIEKGDYLDAAVQAMTLKENGAAVFREIEAALERVRGKKPRALRDGRRKLIMQCDESSHTTRHATPARRSRRQRPS